jgi:hypothetical protein
MLDVTKIPMDKNLIYSCEIFWDLRGSEDSNCHLGYDTI